MLAFKYFIEYLVNLPVNSFNIHLKPMYLTCKPCLVNYDVVGRMISLNEDSQHILTSLGLNQTIAHDHPNEGGSSRDKLLKYYSELDQELLEKLYKLYEMDFILFDYDKKLLG